MTSTLAARFAAALALAPLGVVRAASPPPTAPGGGATSASSAASQRGLPRFTALCADREGCAVTQVHDAGPDPYGAAMQVAELSLPVGTTGPNGQPLPCAPRELWLLRGEMPALRVLHLCNDGYGASGVGEDTVSVGPNRLVHARLGGSAWRWSEQRTWQLAPLELLESQHQSFHAADPGRESQTLHDRRSGRWRTSWTTPSCGGAQRSFDWVPDAGAAVPPDGSALGSCAAAADSAGERGFVVQGPVGTAADARLWASLSRGRVLTIDIVDDVVVDAPGEDQAWVAADHVELWMGARAPDRSMDWDCEAERPQRWAVMLDGSVVAPVGQPDEAVGGTVRARRVAAGPPGRLRLVVELPAGVGALTVVYSDADEEGGQERRIATSQLHHGDGHSLGGIGRLTDQECRDVGGRWTVLDRWRPAP